MFRLLFCSSVSACFELDNKLAYYSERAFRVFLNGSFYGEFSSNVFSIFNLSPSCEYTVSTDIDDFTLSFKTRAESCCISIVDFGAKPLADCTTAIQNAINCCPPKGRIIVPKGQYISGALVLKSDITIELKKDAVIVGSTKKSRFPVVPGEISSVTDGKKIQCATWEGTPTKSHLSLISAFSSSDIVITGEGTIDGNGELGGWYVNPKQRKIGRPRLVFLNNCNNVVIHGISGGNSASWNFHPFFSKNISFYDIKIFAKKDSPNTDGCDPESCENVNIIGVRFSVGDDCIAIKSGKMYMGKKYKTPSSNLVVRNCLMQYGHGGVVLGSEMSGGVRNLEVSQCVFEKTDRGLRIKTRRGRGDTAVIDNITFENIVMKNVLAPLVINMFYFCDPDGKTEYVWSKEKLAVDERTPYIGRFTFRDITCYDYEQTAAFFYGLPEQPIKEAVFENVRFFAKENANSGTPAMMSFAEEYKKAGMYFNNVERVVLDGVELNGHLGEDIISANVGEIVKG